MNQQNRSPISWKTGLRWLVGAIVIAALFLTIRNGWEQLSTNPIRLSSIEVVWLIGATLAYITTMVFSCWYWHRVLNAFGQKPPFAKSMLAFFSSQLGKYVPGKAMVVVIRTDIVRGVGVKTAPAAASVFVETLTWIFVGSAIASLLLVFRFRDQPVLVATSIALTIIAGTLTFPPVFRAIAKKLLAAQSKKVAKTVDGLRFSTMAQGWAIMTVGWCLNGLSLWLVLKSLPGTAVTPADFWLTLACVSLATVAGFVSLLPGGIGVRELVMIPLLGTRFGPAVAIMAAVLIRLVWLAAELLTSAIIYVVASRKTK